MASVFMTSFDHDHYDIKEETSPRRRQLQQKTVVKSKYQLAKELKAARREQQRLFEDRTLDELVFKASLGHIRVQLLLPSHPHTRTVSPQLCLTDTTVPSLYSPPIMQGGPANLE